MKDPQRPSDRPASPQGKEPTAAVSAPTQPTAAYNAALAAVAAMGRVVGFRKRN